MISDKTYASKRSANAIYNAYKKVAGNKGMEELPLPSALSAAPKNQPYINSKTTFTLLQTAFKQTKDPAIGLAIGQSIVLSEYYDKRIVNAIMCSGSLRQSHFIIRRYHSLTQNFNVANMNPVGKVTAVEWKFAFDDPEYCRLAADMVLTMSLALARWLSWTQTSRLVAVHFRHKAPDYIEKYKAIFGCKIFFDQPIDAIYMNTRSLDLPLPQSNPAIMRRECRELDIALLSLEDPESARVQTAKIIRSLIGTEVLNLERIAEKLTVSPRSLRRNLKTEMTNYRDILKTIRKDLCEQYLLEGEDTLQEIAKKLGYNDTTAFNRAFKLWFGKSPKAYARDMSLRR